MMRRWLQLLRNFRNYPKELNRRAKVEQQMWDCYHGKAELPDKEQLRLWALELGVPEWHGKGNNTSKRA